MKSSASKESSELLTTAGDQETSPSYGLRLTQARQIAAFKNKEPEG